MRRTQNKTIFDRIVITWKVNFTVCHSALRVLRLSSNDVLMPRALIVIRMGSVINHLKSKVGGISTPCRLVWHFCSVAIDINIRRRLDCYLLIKLMPSSLAYTERFALVWTAYRLTTLLRMVCCMAMSATNTFLFQFYGRNGEYEYMYLLYF